MSANANIEAGFTREYTANIQLVSQQLTHKLAGTYAMQPGVSGEQAVAVDLVGEMTGGLRKSRLEDVEDNAPTQKTPWLVPFAYSTGAAIDTVDKLKSRIGLDGSYTKAAVAWVNRTMDEQIINAFFADIKIGKLGTDTEVFGAASDNQVGASVGAGSAVGYNVEKLLRARELVKKFRVDLDDPDNQLFTTINAQQERELINDIRIGSKEYRDQSLFDSTNTKLLQFFGINFIHTEISQTSGGNFLTPFWCKSGIVVGEWQGLQGDVRQLTSKKMKPWYTEVSFMRGVTRVERAKVIQVLNKV